MTQAVVAFCIYGVGDPFNNVPGSESPAIVLYTNGQLPTSGLPAELTCLTMAPVIRPILVGFPGVNFGASPRSPFGSGGTLTVRLADDEAGSLGKLFLPNDDDYFWTLQEAELLSADVVLTMKGPTTPPQMVYYLENEAFFLENTVTSSDYTWNIEVTRGYYGSFPQPRSLAPKNYSPGEKGVGDGLFITKRPNWDNGFFCGLYVFILDQYGAYQSHILRRGVVVGEPTPKESPYYDIQVKMLEDYLADHQIGEESREVSLRKKLVVEEFESGSNETIPKYASVLFTREEAEQFFNVCLHEPGSDLMTSTLVNSLKARLHQDSEILPQMMVDDGDVWLFNIDDIRLHTFTTNINNNYRQHLKVKLSLVTQSEGATIGEGS